MTDLGGWLVALTVAAIVNLVVVAQVRRRLPGPDGQWLARIYLISVGLRYLIAAFLNVYVASLPFAQGYWGDSSTYDSGGRALALYWSGATLVHPGLSFQASGYGFFYFVGALYFLFGQNQLLVQFMNGTVGGLGALLVFAIAREIFGIEVARKAMKMMSFFPQVIFWSAGMYKDPAIILCIGVCMYSVIRLARRFAPGHVLLFVLSGLALVTLRFYVFYIIALATLGTFVIAQRRNVAANLLSQVALVGVFLAAFAYSVGSERIAQQQSYLTFERLQITRADQARWGQSAFASEVDVSTPAGALAALPVGLAFLLFAPFPWSAGSLRQMLTIPEMLVWYSLMPALWRGLRHAVRHRFRETLPILAFTAMLTVAYAVFQGNVGTAYRQRTQITMFFFVFMGVGLAERERLRAQAQEARAQRAAAARPVLVR